MTPEEFWAIWQVLNTAVGKEEFVDEMNSIRTALYSNTHHLDLEMSSYSHPSQQLDSRAPTCTSLSSTETSSVIKSSADEECMSTSDSHLTSGSIVCSSSSHGSTVDRPLSLSSNCGELKSTPNRVDNVHVSPEILPLLSACGEVTINRETQNQTVQLESVEKSVQLEMSDCSFSSQDIPELALSQSSDSHGISYMDNPVCSVQVKVDQTGLLMEEHGNSASVVIDNSEQSTISSYQSDPFISGTTQQSSTVESCTCNACSGKNIADTNDQGMLNSKETNDQCQGSALSSKETNDQCQGSETNIQCQGSETNDQCKGSALSSKDTNDQCQGSALSSKDTNDQCQGSALSSKDTNDQCQGSALSSKDTNDQYQGSALSSKDTNDQCQGSALSSKDTNDPCLGSTWSSEDGSRKLYNFVIFFHDDDADAAECIFCLLEQKHGLRGFKNGRDDTPGTYKNDEDVKAIENSEKILLLLTPKSIGNDNFKFRLTLSLNHSIENIDTKLIPIRSGIQGDQVPKSIRYRCCINYNNFSNNFQASLSKVFHVQSSLTSSVSKPSDSHSTCTSPTCSMESESSTKSSDSSKLGQCHSTPPSIPQEKPKSLRKWLPNMPKWFSRR